MAILNILQQDDPILREKCKDIPYINKDIKNLINDMIETMEVNKGIGLAAPQIGKTINLIIVKVNNKNLAMINPKILSKEGEIKVSERCLSCEHGDYVGTVTRAEFIKVRYTDKNNKIKILPVKGLIADCIQHEIDHLEGKLFIDIAEDLRIEKIEDENTKLKE